MKEAIQKKNVIFFSLDVKTQSVTACLTQSSFTFSWLLQYLGPATLGMALRQSWKALLRLKCGWHNAWKPWRGMERAELGAFSFGSSWGINFFFFPYFPLFRDEYAQHLSKTMVLDLYG